MYLSEARDLLQRQGMSVVGVASNGGDALAIAASGRPDVALVDVDLGAESGLDVARTLAMCDEPLTVILISLEKYPQGIPHVSPCSSAL